MPFHAHNRVAIQGAASAGTAFRPNDLGLTARSGGRTPLSLLIVVIQTAAGGGPANLRFACDCDANVARNLERPAA